MPDDPAKKKSQFLKGLLVILGPLAEVPEDEVPEDEAAEGGEDGSGAVEGNGFVTGGDGDGRGVL